MRPAVPPCLRGEYAFDVGAGVSATQAVVRVRQGGPYGSISGVIGHLSLPLLYSEKHYIVICKYL